MKRISKRQALRLMAVETVIIVAVLLFVSPDLYSKILPTIRVGEGRGEDSSSLGARVHEEYPLLAYTPYYSDAWKIGYLRVKTLEVILNKDTKETRQEVIDWIESKGVDPKTHEIFWHVATPTP